MEHKNLLKQFLILNPTKRGTFEKIMKDPQMYMDENEDELKSKVDLLPDYSDPQRIELMVPMVAQGKR